MDRTIAVGLVAVDVAADSADYVGTVAAVVDDVVVGTVGKQVGLVVSLRLSCWQCRTGCLGSRSSTKFS